MLPRKYKASLQISVEAESLNCCSCEAPCQVPSVHVLQALTASMCVLCDSELNHSPAFSQSFLSPTVRSFYFPAGFENDRTAVTLEMMMQYPFSRLLLSHKIRPNLFFFLLIFSLLSKSYGHPNYCHFSSVTVHYKTPKSLCGRRGILSTYLYTNTVFRCCCLCVDLFSPKQ